MDTFHAVYYNFHMPNLTFEHYYPFSNLHLLTINKLKFYSNKKLKNEKLNKKSWLFQKFLELHLLFVCLFYEKSVSRLKYWPYLVGNYFCSAFVFCKDLRTLKNLQKKYRMSSISWKNSISVEAKLPMKNCT